MHDADVNEIKEDDPSTARNLVEEDAGGPGKLRGINKIVHYLTVFKLRDQLITDIEPSESSIDKFIEVNELISLILSIQVNYSRVARLIVLFCGIVG